MAQLKELREVFDYDAQPKERLFTCNCCGAGACLQEVGEHDRYGYFISHTICDVCGLKWLTRRMPPAAYAEFYRSGAYRRLVSHFHGRDMEAGLEHEQWLYAAKLAAVLRPHARHQTDYILDVGGGRDAVVGELVAHCLGGNSDEWCVETCDPEATGETLEMTQRRGHYHAVLICQTVDHLTDIRAGLERVRLGDGGVLWVDILDTDQVPEWKIDHPFQLTDSVMRRYLDQAGFEVAATADNLTPKHKGYVAKRRGE